MYAPTDGQGHFQDIHTLNPHFLQFDNASQEFLLELVRIPSFYSLDGISKNEWASLARIHLKQIWKVFLHILNCHQLVEQ